MSRTIGQRLKKFIFKTYLKIYRFLQIKRVDNTNNKWNQFPLDSGKMY